MQTNLSKVQQANAINKIWAVVAPKNTSSESNNLAICTVSAEKALPCSTILYNKETHVYQEMCTKRAARSLPRNLSIKISEKCIKRGTSKRALAKGQLNNFKGFLYFKKLKWLLPAREACKSWNSGSKSRFLFELRSLGLCPPSSGNQPHAILCGCFLHKTSGTLSPW